MAIFVSFLPPSAHCIHISRLAHNFQSWLRDTSYFPDNLKQIDGTVCRKFFTQFLEAPQEYEIAVLTSYVAAMRLRQLATTQSVTFFVPLEVHQSIMDVCGGKKADETFDSSHVIRWLLEQTCSGIEQLQPLYYAQGADFCRRIQAATDNPEFASLEPHRDTYLGIVRQNEQQTVQQLYKPRTQLKSTKAKTTFSPTMAAYMKELDMRRKGFQDNGNAVQSSTLQEVEQEREVAHEVEAVREVQKPVHFSPLAFPGLHRDIESFLRTGRLAAGSAGYELALDALARTGLGIKHAIGPGTLASRLFVSQEFRNTIKLIQGRPNDSFLVSDLIRRQTRSK